MFIGPNFFSIAIVLQLLSTGVGQAANQRVALGAGVTLGHLAKNALATRR